jgi:prepilin-type N-terminal cleavage/methylation domain-containing protein
METKTFFKSKTYTKSHLHGIAFALKNGRSFVFVATFFKEQIMKDTVRIRERESGFSLIELLVIIVIIAILAAIAIPAFSGWLPNYRLRQAARDVYSNLQRAKVNAIKSNTEWRVYFDIPGDRYFLCSGPGANAAWDNPPAMGGDDDVETTINLSTYKDVDFGNGSAGTGIDGWAFGAPISYANPVTNFTSRGTVGLTGYVYLSNAKGSVIGVGTPSPAGVIVLKRFNGAVWQ